MIDVFLTPFKLDDLGVPLFSDKATWSRYLDKLRRPYVTTSLEMMAHVGVRPFSA